MNCKENKRQFEFHQLCREVYYAQYEMLFKKGEYEKCITPLRSKVQKFIDDYGKPTDDLDEVMNYFLTNWICNNPREIHPDIIKNAIYNEL
jgi:hypothetical protein